MTEQKKTNAFIARLTGMEQTKLLTAALEARRGTLHKASSTTMGWRRTSLDLEEASGDRKSRRSSELTCCLAATGVD